MVGEGAAATGRGAGLGAAALGAAALTGAGLATGAGAGVGAGGASNTGPAARIPNIRQPYALNLNRLASRDDLASAGAATPRRAMDLANPAMASAALALAFTSPIICPLLAAWP